MLKRSVLCLVALVAMGSMALADDSFDSNETAPGLVAKTTPRTSTQTPTVWVDSAQHVADGISINFAATHIKAAKAGSGPIDVPSQDDKECVRKQMLTFVEALKQPEFKAEIQMVSWQSIYVTYQLVDGIVGKNGSDNPAWYMRLGQNDRSLAISFYRDDSGCKVIEAPAMLEAARVAQEQRVRNAVQWSSEISTLGSVLKQLKATPTTK